MPAFLFVPADQGRKVESALHSRARTIVLDLEDAVAPAGKGDARAALGAAARSLRSAGKRVMVRINTEGQGYDGRDLQAALDAPLDELLLPKVEREEALQAVEERIGRSAHAATLRLVLLVETARGLRDLPALLAAPARPRRATLGMADLCRDLGIDWISAVRDEPPLFVDEVTRLRVLSRACGCEPPLGCVYPLIDDEAGLRRNATLEARLGYAGKFVIHPRQIDVVESVFRPTSAEVARARAIVEAFERAQRAGAGAVQVEGLMVDEPVARAAYALLERAGT